MKMTKINDVKIYTNKSIGNTFSLNGRTSVEYRSEGPSEFEKNIAERKLLQRIYTGCRSVQECHIDHSRAKFLIVFSPDGTKLASTNGNHNVYIIDVVTNKVLKTLEGHKRTPWTVAFHPSDNNTLATGCLGGEVRIWNLEDDSCEVWQSPGHTVIASIAFHPKVKLLAIATYQDIYFWNWSTSYLYGQTSTRTEEEKIRYVKFDSTGDKLITAIALSFKLISQYDSITFREVFRFTRERCILKDIKLIEKYCKNYSINVTKMNLESRKIVPFEKHDCTQLYNRMMEGSADGQKLSLVGETMPFMCVYHFDAIQPFLNVNVFCPTEFSYNILDMYKENLLPVEFFVEKCYFCRYTWLYYAIFRLQILNEPSNHICKQFRFTANDKHPWKFSGSRTRELIEENTNSANGLTEETFRYCIEQYARARIVPYYAELVPNDGVCSKCYRSDVVEYEYVKEEGADVRKPFTHNIPMRSDCFLRMCDTFKFNPSGTFTPFMTAFAELYNYLPSLQQISTEGDRTYLNTIMTEWEHLYCKFLFINNIVEGDDGFILRKRLAKLNLNKNLLSNPKRSIEEGVCSNLYYRRQEFRKRLSRSKHNDLIKKMKLHGLVNHGASTSFDGLTGTDSSQHSAKYKTLPDDVGNSKKSPKKECQLCKNFDEGSDTACHAAIKLLHDELNALSIAILRRNESKAQCERMEKLYEEQLKSEINRIDGALFRTIQITKKSIRMYLASFLTELKKLLKVNFASSITNDLPFNNVFMRLFVFATRRAISFTNLLLEFLCNFKYDIEELTRIDSVKVMNSPPLSPTIPFRQIRYPQMPHVTARYSFEINTNEEPVFKEECEPIPSEYADDEFSATVTDNVLSGVSDREYFAHFGGMRSNSTGVDFVDSRVSQISWRQIVASPTYLTKHLKFLDVSTDRSLREQPAPDNNEILLLQNVNLLLNQLQSQSIKETSEYRSSHKLHRLQMWDFSNLEIPIISDKMKNIVVTECKVHNDATISISNDDTRIAVLLSPNQFDQPDWLGVFSLEWKTLGQILCAVSFSQIAVSLSFSPTSQFLAVGFSFVYSEDLKMADIIAVQREIDNWRNFGITSRRPSPIATSLIDIKNVYYAEMPITINCITWTPVPGHGLVFGNSTGDIKFIR